LLTAVPVPPLAVTDLEPVIGPERYTRLLTTAAEFRARLGRRAIWTVSSTAVGGGVAEMLQVLVAYAEGLDIPIRWLVIGGDPEFFAITKALHNQIHGHVGSTGMVGPAAAGHYEQVLAANADALLKQVRPGDLVLLHDPQTAGLTGALTERGALVVWRSHIGVDFQNDVTRAAWDFLWPYVEPARGFVFTRRQYVPPWIPPALTRIIPPSIDPFSAKNEELSAGAVAPAGDGYLMLVGPEVSGVSDDPEGASVLADCLAQWQSLPAATRSRILLVTLPLDDIEENAAMINAIQRHAAVIVQKSLAEGFGLTVAEGMWKSRPVVGSAVGGILDQIAEGTGVLLRDPADLPAFGSRVRWLLDHPDAADRMGRAGHEHVREHYLGDRHLLQYAELFEAVIGA